MKRLAVIALGLLSALPLGAEEPKSPAPARGPRIAVEPASFDFGEVLPQKSLEKEFSVRNFGSEDLVIASLSTSCGCTAALMDNNAKTIKPGASSALRVTLQTRGDLGRLAKSVLIRSNDKERASLEVKISATVVKGP